MSRWIVFAGITAMLVTGYFAALDTRGAGALRSVRFLPDALQAQAMRALKDNGLAWASVEMDGQRALLSGLAPSELDRDDAIETVRRSAGRGGALWGGITAVDATGLKVSPPRKPFSWTAKRGDGLSVRLSGHVPSQRARREIARAARSLFPNGVEDSTVVASGYPTGDWVGSVKIGLAQLQRVASGELQFNDGALVLFGQAEDDGLKASIETAISAVRRPLSGSAELTTVDRQTAPPPPEETVPAAGQATSTVVAPSANCQTLIDTAMRDNVIPFGAGSAMIDLAGQQVIESMARTALMCPELKLKVTGHADGTPVEARASDISRQRALAVSQLLRARGVDLARMVVIGAGAEQPLPDADAENPAANRRVEVTVIP